MRSTDCHIRERERDTCRSWCWSMPSPGSYDSNDDPLSMWNMGGSLRRGEVRRHSSASSTADVDGSGAGALVVDTAVVATSPAAADSPGWTADGCRGGREDGPTISSPPPVVGLSIGDHMPDCQQKSNDLLFCLRPTHSRRRRSARPGGLEAASAACALRYHARGSSCEAARPSSTSAVTSHTRTTPPLSRFVA